MRICFVGTVEGSKVAFDALVDAGYHPDLLVTLSREAAVRHSDFIDLATPARDLGIPVHHTGNINAPETIAAISAIQPDLTFVVGWSQICRQPFRDIARIGSVGFHPSPLPRLRGRGVIPWTILRGETTGGSTLFWLDEGIDSGDILLQRIFPIDPEETARSLYDKHTRCLREMIPEAARLVESNSAPRNPQNEDDASYCARRRPEDGMIDWSVPASSVLKLIRAVGEPYPGSFTHLDGERIRIDEAVLFSRSDRYIGLPGQVQAIADGSFIVMCGNDECIEVRKWHSKSGKAPPVHSKLA